MEEETQVHKIVKEMGKETEVHRIDTNNTGKNLNLSNTQSTNSTPAIGEETEVHRILREMNDETEAHRIVRESYANRATGATGGCCGAQKTCCSSKKMLPSSDMQRDAEKMGYTQEDIANVPEESNLGLGCGAPLASAAIQPGEIVLDLGSGAGFDAFLASHRVGKEGKVIGVDMTPEMVEKAKVNKTKRGSSYSNVEFRVGKIECLPVGSDSVDVIISNCVINLSPDKPAVFREAYRVLKPGGRITLSDICLTQDLPESVQNNLSAYLGCIAGASTLDNYLGGLRNAGFVRVGATTRHAFDVLANDDPAVLAAVKDVESDQDDVRRLKQTIVSATVLGYKE